MAKRTHRSFAEKNADLLFLGALASAVGGYWWWKKNHPPPPAPSGVSVSGRACDVTADCDDEDLA